MSFLSRLFGSKKDDRHVEPQPVAISTNAEAKSLSTAYAQAFYEVMSTIDSFTEQDLNTMLSMINDGPGGHLNLFRWVQPVFDRFFANKDCHWPELEKWNAIFESNGRGAIFRQQKLEELTVAEMCKYLKVPQIKEAMKALGISAPPKATKEKLVPILEASTTPQTLAENCPEWPAIADNLVKRWRKDFLQILYGHIHSLANRLHSINRLEGVHEVKWELHIIPKENEPLVKLALAENPAAEPPFFPTDLSLRTLTIL